MTKLDNFSNVRILVIGDLMLDRYWWGDVTRISPEAPVPIVKLGRMSVAAGGAANVAANAGGLGASVVLVGVTGDDEEGNLLTEILDASPNLDHHVIALASRETTVKTRIVAHNQQVVRLDRESTHVISHAEAEVVANHTLDRIADVDAVIISDYAKGMLTERLLGQIIEAANTAGKMVFVDPKGKDFSKYRGATMITPNLHEAANACGLELNDPDLVAHSGRLLIEKFSLKGSLITEGENGMTLFEADGGKHHLDAVARKVFDVTGAGDTVIATFAVAAASGMTFVEAARLANIAAGIAVGQIGTAVVTCDQLESAA